LQNDATNATLKQFFYSYDPAANRTSEQIDTAVTSGTYNSLNQLTSRQAGGKIRFQGTLNEPGTVTVGGQPAWMQGGTNFVADVGLTSGTNSVPVVAKDANNNTQTNTYQVIVPGGTGKTISYDAAGNTTSDGTHTFTWDAASRLVKITYADSATSEFGYDAFGRRIWITEKDPSGTATSTKQFLWDGLAIAEERDASNTVTARYFEEGFQRIQSSPSSTQNYFTSRDHLGSVREVVDNTGTFAARYNYDPFGRITKLSGTVDCDMLYTGHYYHEKSALSLAPYRASDAETGRWLSSDPIVEDGGINLYGYVSNNPVNLWDPWGMAPGDWWDVRTPAHNRQAAEDYGESMRGRGGNDSDHHAIAVRDFAERMEDSYGSSAIGDISAVLAAAAGNYAEIFGWDQDSPDDLDANMLGMGLRFAGDVRFPFEKPCK